MVLAGLLLVGTGMEPTRGQFVEIVARYCGEVSRYVTDTLHLNDPTGAQRASTCFAHAYAQCQAVTLVVSAQTGLDTYWMDALIVEPAIGPLRPCRLVDAYSAGLLGRGRIQEHKPARVSPRRSHVCT